MSRSFAYTQACNRADAGCVEYNEHFVYDIIN